MPIFDGLHLALAAACERDLPDIYQDPSGRSAEKYRRPGLDEIEVIMFLQGWGSTALGYGGFGGQSISSAYTIIVISEVRYHCVYFGCGRLAYGIDLEQLTPQGRLVWMTDLANRDVAAVGANKKYYV